MKMSPRKDWQPPLTIAIDWSIIVCAALTAMHFGNELATIAALLVIGSRQHALLVMVHEGVHYNLSRNKLLNEFMADYLCAFPVLFDTFAYRRNHLAHHANLNTDKDPDWVRKVGREDWTFPVPAKRMAMFIPFFMFLKGPLEWAYITYRFSGFFDRSRWGTHPVRLTLKLAYYLALVTAIWFSGWGPSIAIYWLLPLFIIFPIIQRLRSVAEHFSLPYTNEMTSSRNVVTSWIEEFFFAPHNVNYHLIHHLNPHVPFYGLPGRFAEMKRSNIETGYQNHSYLFPFTGSVLEDLLRGHQLQKKET